MEKFNCSVYEISDAVESLIEEGAVVPFYVSGSSMNPFLVSRRDIVYLRKHSDADLKKGSILLYKRQNGGFVLHRVKKITADGKLLLCGDAQRYSETVERTRIVAVAVEIERKGVRRNSESFYFRSINALWRMLTPVRPLIMRVWFKIRRMKNKQ